MKKIFLFLAGALLLAPSFVVFAQDQEEVLAEGEQEMVEVIQEESEEPASQVTEPVVPAVSTMTKKMRWQWIEDELLLGPGYATTFLAPLKGLGAVGGLWALNRSVRNGNGPSYATPRSWVNTVREKLWKKGNFSEFTHKVLLAVGALAGYKLTKWALESIVYGFALNSFLHNYPQINRDKTPEALRPYLDEEYNEFVKGGFTYLAKRSKKVIGFIRMSVKMHKKGVAF